MRYKQDGESGVNTNMTRRYARAVGGARAVDSTPLNIPANTTILYSIRINGATAYTTYQGDNSGKVRKISTDRITPVSGQRFCHCYG